MRYARASFLADWNGGRSALAFEPTTPEQQDPYHADWTTDLGAPLAAPLQGRAGLATRLCRRCDRRQPLDEPSDGQPRWLVSPPGRDLGHLGHPAVGGRGLPVPPGARRRPTFTSTASIARRTLPVNTVPPDHHDPKDHRTLKASAGRLEGNLDLLCLCMAALQYSRTSCAPVARADLVRLPALDGRRRRRGCESR